MIDVVFFDVDGTLVDHDGAASRAVTQWVVGQGWSGPSDELVSLWEAIAERNFTMYRAGQISFQEQRRSRVREFLPILGVGVGGWTSSQLDATFENYLRHYEAAWQTFDDVRPGLERIHGDFRLAVLSNGDQDQQEQKLRAVDLDSYFDNVMTSSVLGKSKPDVRAFELACEGMNTEPGRALCVGDQLEVDVQPALSAGLQAALVDRSRSYHHQSNAYQVVSGLTELIVSDDS